MGFPEQLVPSEVKNQRLQPFLPPPGKGANPGPPREVKKKNKFSRNQKETQSGPKGTLPQEGKPQCTENQEDIGTIEPLRVF